MAEILLVLDWIALIYIVVAAILHWVTTPLPPPSVALGLLGAIAYLLIRGAVSVLITIARSLA